MKKNFAFSIITLFSLIPSSWAQSTDTNYYPETGRWSIGLGWENE